MIFRTHCEVYAGSTEEFVVVYLRGLLQNQIVMLYIYFVSASTTNCAGSTLINMYIKGERRF